LAAGFALAAAAVFFLPVPGFEGRAVVRGPADFVPTVFREADPLAVGFPATAGSSGEVFSVTRAAARAAAFSLPVLALDGSAIFPVVATVVSEGIGAHERRRGK